MTKKNVYFGGLVKELVKNFSAEIDGLVKKKSYIVENSTANHGKTIGVIVEFVESDKSDAILYLYYDLSRSKMRSLKTRPKVMKKIDFENGQIERENITIYEKFKQMA